MAGEEIAERLAAVRERIAHAAERAGRDPAEVLLVAVTKDVDPERILRAVAAGAADLGENRAQELVRKREALPDVPARWHFIGTLQRNKVRAVAGRVALIHSVDSVPLGESVARRAADSGSEQHVLVQVNVSGEGTKTGVDPAAAAEVVGALRAVPGLRVRGLTTIAPAEEPEAARASFRALRLLRDELAGRYAEVRELSMGMTSDFEAAVEEGATIVRVGTAIFGPRHRAGPRP